MSTAFEKIGTDRQLQDHWIRRLIAGVIDYVIIWIIAWMILVLAQLQALLLGPVPFFIGPSELFHGVIFFLYASFFEFRFEATIGKQIANLKVMTTQGKMASLDRTLIRSISKIHWVLWLTDTLLGMATLGDPHQKYSDRFAGTTVAYIKPVGQRIIEGPPHPFLPHPPPLPPG